MDTEFIKNQDLLLKHLNHFIKDVLYGSIHNFHVQLYKETNGDLEQIEKLGGLCTVYVAGYVTRYFNGGIRNWIRHEDQENRFRNMATPIKQVIGHGYTCFLNLLFMFCTQTLMKIDLSKVKFDPEKMDFDKLGEQIDAILEEAKELHISAFNHQCSKQDDIKDWDPEVERFRIGDPEDSEGREEVEAKGGEVWSFQKVVN